MTGFNRSRLNFTGKKMTHSRRKFLKTGVVFGLAIAAAPNAFGQIRTAAKPSGRLLSGDRLAALNKADFSARLGETFQITQGKKLLELRLIEVSDLPPVFQRETGIKFGENFSLKFHGFSEAALPQQTGTFTNAGLGSFDLFIVPNRSEANSHYYEAVFNRIYL